MALRALALLLAPIACAGWRREGTLPTASHFTVYAGKFCFDYTKLEEGQLQEAAGAIEVFAEGLVEDNGNGNLSFEGQDCIDGSFGGNCHTGGQLYFMAFSDQAQRWERARGLWDELECEERLRYSSVAMPLSPRLNGNDVKDRLEALSAAPMSMNASVNIMQKLRPRFWHFAFVNCGARIIKPVSFELHARNLKTGIEAELGTDMRGAQWLETAFAALFAAASATAALAAARGRAQQGGARSRPLLLLLRVSAALSALGCGLRAAHHWAFLGDGQGLPCLGVAGSLFACGARLLLTVLQFFIGKGWALFVSPGEQTQRRMIFLALLLVMGVSAACEIKAHYFHDADTDFYLYASWPGLLMLALNLSLLGASWLMTWDTYLKEPSPAVRSYYRTVSLAAGVYFASMPVICLVAGALSPWVVRKIVERTEMGSRFTATVLLLVCLWPSRVDALVAARLKNRSQASLMKADEAGMEELGESSPEPRRNGDAELNSQLG